MRPLFTLGARLALCADLVRPGRALCDVGTDHAYLPIWLLKMGKIPRALACDVNPGPLEAARRDGEKYQVGEGLTLRLSDGLRQVTPEEAEGSLFGFTCANDVTAREVQKADPLIGHCKSYDTFCPIGPWVETELEDINDLSIRCLVNGETRQSANTGDMIFRPLDLLCFLSRVMTLMPGDVILTGTPPGISPIQADDVVQVSIEGIGTLSTPVERPGPEEKILQ